MHQKINKQNIGRLGEQLASKYYQNIGYTILDHNVVTPYGEIDLLLLQDQKIIIVEVKTRHNQKYGWPEESISHKKIKNIINSWHYLQKKFNYFDNYPSMEICSVRIKARQAKIKRFMI